MYKKNGKPLTKEEIKQIIITELPKLLKRDLQTREFIARLFQEKFADKKKTEDRFEKLLKEINQQRLESEKKWEEQNKRWEENNKRIDAILEEIKLLHRKHDTTIGALGARWGLRAESSFRDAIKGILEESFPVKVQRYKAKHEEGIVFGKPDQVELDLIVKNGEVIVAEIKSSISKGDVATFLRKIDFYEKKEKASVKRKIMISPMFDYGAREFALSSGIEVYGYPEEVDFKELQSEN